MRVFCAVRARLAIWLLWSLIICGVCECCVACASRFVCGLTSVARNLRLIVVRSQVNNVAQINHNFSHQNLQLCSSTVRTVCLNISSTIHRRICAFAFADIHGMQRNLIEHKHASFCSEALFRCVRSTKTEVAR